MNHSFSKHLQEINTIISEISRAGFGGGANKSNLLELKKVLQSKIEIAKLEKNKIPS